MKEKVLLFALENINNVGEELLRETTEYLVKTSSDNVEIKIAQFRPSNKYIKNRFKVTHRISSYVRRISQHFHGNNAYRLLNLSYKVKYTRYFEEQIKLADRVVTSVGMFKYSTQDFSYIYHLVAKICQKYHKPLMISAPSLEDYNPNDWRSVQLVKTANIPSVKMITTRDGIAGLNTLTNCYLVNNEFQYDNVADPALWIPECYHVKRNHSISSTPYIGINVIRKGIFDDYNKTFTDEELFLLYAGLIKQIEKRGWRWAVYSNGMPQDIEVIKELHSSLNFSKDHILKRPQNAKEFIEMVKGFDAVFGSRLHSCITAVSLGVPVVGFIWDNKLRYFAETMNRQSFFFEPKDMSADNIVNALELAMKSGYDFTTIDNLKEKTLSSIQKFLETKY